MVKRKKILITGASGTVGNILYMHLGPWHDVHVPRSVDLNLRNRVAVAEYLRKNEWFDVIIHCAIRGADDVKSTNQSIATDNLKMYFNLADYSRHYGKFINIASGCEFGYDVPLDVGPNIMIEDIVEGAMPEYPYGLSKNIIARDVRRYSNRYNLRLWGLISQTRLFSKIWVAADTGEREFVIDSDRYMDYIAEDDMVKIVNHYVNSEDITAKDVNMVYNEKLKVSEVAERYIDDNGLDLTVKVTGQADSNYYGSGALLRSMGIL